jgi:hypothetical protein
VSANGQALTKLPSSQCPAEDGEQTDEDRRREGRVNVLSLRDGRTAWIAGFVDPQVLRHFSVTLQLPRPDRARAH